jgi:hypothetical protein
MICPQCEAEYLDGYNECADCRVPLVTLETLAAKKIGAQKAAEEFTAIEHVPVRVIADSGQILFLQSVMEGEGIAYYWHNDHSSMFQFQTPNQLMMVDIDKLNDLKQVFKDLEIDSDLDFPSVDHVEPDVEEIFSSSQDGISSDQENTSERTPTPQTINDLLESSDIEGLSSNNNAFERKDSP